MRATAGLAVLALVVAGCAVEPVADDGVADTAPAASSVPPASSASTIDSVSKPAGPGVEVESVVDGAPERVRLIGIDTPEAGECLVEEAAVRLAELVATGEVRLVPDRSERDQFGRLLRYVDLDDGSSANTVLVAEGLALARSYPPDTARDHELARPSVAAFEAGPLAAAEYQCRNGFDQLAPESPGSPVRLLILASTPLLEPPPSNRSVSRNVRKPRLTTKPGRCDLRPW